MTGRWWNRLATLLGLVVLAGGAWAFEVEMTEQQRCLTEAIAEKSVVLGTWNGKNRTNGEPVALTVTVEAPDGKVLYNQADKTEGFFAFHAETAGTYRACFNAPSQGVASQTKIGLTWHVGMQMENWNKLVDKEHMDALVAELGKLEIVANSLYEEMSTIRKQEEEMRDLNERVNTRVVFFSVATLAISITLTAAQICYLRRFFKAKKVL